MATFRTAGNAYHLQRQFAQAVECYSKGLEVDPSNHLLLGNKSASLFEMGKYSDSSASAKAALSLEEKRGTESEKWRLKLVSRVVLCAIQLGLGQNSLHELDPDLLQHKDVASLVNLFGVKRVSELDPLLVKATSVFTRPTIVSMPTGFEYFPVGHDPARSLIAGNEGLNDRETTRDALKRVPVEKLKSFSVLMGGCGDARHMYATLDDFKFQFAENRPKGFYSNNVSMKFLLNDLNPTILARQILILTFIMRLGRAKPSRTNPDFTLNLAVLTYLYVGMAVPTQIFDAIYSAICEFAEDFEASLAAHLPFVCFFDVQSSKAIHKVFCLWRDKSQAYTAQKILLGYNRGSGCSISKPDGSPNADMSDAMKSIYERKKQETASERTSDISDQAPSQQIESGCSYLDARVFGTTFGDSQFLQSEKCLLPPVQLPGLDSRVKNAIEEIRFGFCKDGKMDIVADKDWRILRNYVQQYKANPAMVDFEYLESMGGIVDRTFNVEDVVRMFNHQRIGERDEAGTDVFDFFGMVFYSSSIALERLNVKIKLHVGCMFSLAQELGESSSSDGRFDRITVNNVPDYSGLLNSHLLLTPLLKTDNPKYPAFMISNCLLNTGIWTDYNEYIFSSSMFSDRSEMEFLLGIKFLCGDLFGDDAHWLFNPTPAVANAFDQRDVLVNWLHRLLLGIAYPARRAQKRYAEVNPLTLNTFLMAVERLSKTVPKHWLSQVLQDLLFSSSIKTKAIPPRHSPNKPPQANSAVPTATHVLHTKPIQPELLALTTLWHHNHPESFPRLLFALPSVSEICVIKTPELVLKSAFELYGFNNCLGLAIVPLRIVEQDSGGSFAQFFSPLRFNSSDALYRSVVEMQEGNSYLFSSIWRIERGRDLDDKGVLQLGFTAEREFLVLLQLMDQENTGKKQKERLVAVAVRMDSWDIISEPCSVLELKMI
ncbi:hypothetical protein BDR26DRAFT_916160 [Obelidium mucronatum]|nr:hypothetical protein BDR26DRAFT_916160 [Obelidium mucronatum]